jgi:glycosyltransferase involved in cell wall biosynthesis
MTVAHEEACYAAMRYARRYDLPLVTFFHDWWPDIANVHRPFRSVLDRLFRELYYKSDLPLCVSDEMKTKLGSHPSAQVLLPIPAKRNQKVLDDSPDKDHVFRLLYAGNLKEYGPMLMEALKLLKDQSNVRLEVRGNSSSWPDSVKDEMTKRGLLLPFVPRDELTEWLESADAFLVTQSFDDKQKRAMMTNFPSKLSEFAQYGKPLIIWAPAYASGNVWAREESRALVVDNGDPQYLLQAVERLCDDTDELIRLRHASQTVASGCFDPERIQSDLIRMLGKISRKQRDCKNST